MDAKEGSPFRTGASPAGVRGTRILVHDPAEVVKSEDFYFRITLEKGVDAILVNA